MGRHRRVSHAPEPPTVRYDVGPPRSAVSGYDVGRRQQRGSHRKPVTTPTRGGLSARAGLLGASAAMAMGAVAVASTMVPQPGGGSGTQYSDRVQADGPPDQSPEVPSIPSTDGGTQSPGEGSDGSGDGGSTPPDSSQKPGGSSGGGSDSSRPSDPGGGDQGGGGESQPSDPGGNGQGNGNGSSGGGSGNGNSGGGGSDSTSPATAAEAEVLSLVNEERKDAGCRALKADPDLAELAGDFSRDMAVQGFFSHQSPDGSSPWDRAEALGIRDLGGENIARGQRDAESVMDDWMDSPGHKANILNCNFRTLGVGAYLTGDSGPVWTQNFGY